MSVRQHTPAAAAAFVLTFGLMAPVQLFVDPPVILAERIAPGLGWLEILLLATWAAWLTSRILDDRRSARWRQRLWRLFSAVFFLQLFLGLAGADLFLMTGELHLPVPALIVGGPLFRHGGFFMPILLGVTILLVGPAWCSHLCYIGAWDDVAARSKISQPQELPRWRNVARFGILLGVAAVAVALRFFGAPGLLAGILGGLFGVAGIGVMVFTSRRTGAMAHCSMFCPIGWITTTLGRLNPFRVTIDTSCAMCGLCTPSCRYDALTASHLAAGRVGANCTLCGDCIGACHMRDLEYAFPGLGPQGAKVLFRVLVVSFHAAFMGIGML
jgi:polyferredoxin